VAGRTVQEVKMAKSRNEEKEVSIAADSEDGGRQK
jgi:hypothetical protein